MRRRWLIIMASTLVVCLVAFVVWVQVSLLGELVLRNLLGQSASYITDEDDRVIAILPRELEHHRNPRDKSQDIANLDGRLNLLVRVYESEGLAEAATFVPIPGPEPGTVEVTLYQELTHTGTGSTTEIADSLRSFGVEPFRVRETFLSAFVPIALLRDIAQLEHVQYVIAQYPVVPQQATAAKTHGADVWRTPGSLTGGPFAGQGIKVGIIDIGFDDYNNASNQGLVPAPADHKCFVANRQCSGQVHGTAVVEALVSIAPSVTVYLATAKSPMEVYDAAVWLTGTRDNNNQCVGSDPGPCVDIINMSLGGVWEGPGDGTSYFADHSIDAVNYAVSNDVTWINAAGNYNWSTWFGHLHHRTADEERAVTQRSLFLRRWFTKGYRFDHAYKKPRRWLPINTCNVATLDTNGPLTVLLRWDDTWNQAQLDLDVQVYTGWGRRIPGTNETRQNGRNHPIEVFQSQGSLPEGHYCIQIHNYSAAQGKSWIAPNWVQLQTWQGTLQYISGNHSLAGPAESANRGLLAVGAPPYTFNQGFVWDYSSRGPTVDNQNLNRPDLVGAAGLPSKVYGYDFRGTSQAAPHVAGLAALVKQRFPNYSAVQVADYLRTNADPRPVAVRYIWGYGFAKLPSSAKAVAVASPTPAVVVPTVPTSTAVATTPVPTVMAASVQACPTQGPSPNLECDKQILLSTRDVLRGTDTSALGNWTASTRIADFDGVVVGGALPRVVSVDWDFDAPTIVGVNSLISLYEHYDRLPRREIANNQLKGSIPPMLGRLSHLQTLSLFGNELTGTIPKELSQLSQLEYLDLAGNQLTGPIPPELSQLPLRWLHLPYNQLTGSIPSSLGQLSQLQWLALHDNQLTGAIPAELAQLGQLQLIDISYNQLTGAIPPELGRLNQLSELDLRFNQLTGPIPSELAPHQWVYLLLEGNASIGCVPRTVMTVCRDCLNLSVCH